MFLSWHWRTVESLSKIWMVVSNSAYPKMANFLGAGKKAEISNFIIWFCVKHKLLEQKTDIVASCPDTEVLWKVSSKSELWFLIQATQKCWNLLEEPRRLKFHILSFRLVWKINCLGKKLIQQFLLWYGSTMKGLGENWIVVSNFSQKHCEFLPASMPEVQNWEFGKNWIVVSTECMFLSCHVRISKWIHTLYLSECQGTLCSKRARYLKFTWLQRDLNPQPLSV